jgi:hypothetical protein
MNKKVAALEAQMLSEAKEAIAKKRNALDSIDAAMRAHITKILGYSDFGTEVWLISPCSYLDGERPLNVLSVNSSKVIEAAIRKSKWTNPG